MTTETLPAHPTPEGVIAAVDRGRQELIAARDDFERIAVRDHAAAAAAAAKVLKLRDVQTVASVLVADAERAIAAANPPQGRGKGRKNTVPQEDSILDDYFVPPGHEIPKLRDMRQAHSNIDDDEYAEIVQVALERQEPITRQGLIEHVRRRDKAAKREAALADAAAAPTAEDFEAASEGRVVCSDYRDFLAGLSDVDLVLTDPPYAISKPSGFGAGGDPAFANHRTEFGDWDEAEIDLGALAGGCYAALRPGGTVLIFYDVWKISYLAEALRAAGFGVLRIVEWVKTNPMHVNPESGYLNTVRELAISAVKGSNPTFNTPGHTGRYEHATVRNDGHLTRKPDSLFADLISAHTLPGDLVADPFAGSGTAIRAAKTLGRRWAAADINPVYVQRMEDEHGA